MSERDTRQAGRARAEQPGDGDVLSDADVVLQPSEAPAAETAPPSAEETNALLKQLTVGTVIDGKYQIDAIIGKGAMGVVLAATHVHLKERVALKFLSARPNSQSDDFHSRFRREAQVSAKLRNEHITRVIDVGVWREKVPFMVMDLLVGDDLRRTLRQSPDGRLPAAVALDFIVQVCEGLAEAHSHGIVHRDLKPSNLFVTTRHDGTHLIKILDFGISKWATQHEEQLDELTQTGVVLGSPKYMSPEQLFGSATVDARADVWSLGAIFYEMLTGRPPYDFPTLTRICAELATDHMPPPLSAFVADLPPELEAVVMRCFVRDREQRVSSVAELAGALLESVEAPFAGQVRQRIASMLDPKGQGSSLTSSSGSASLPMSTGNYRSLSLTGSSLTGPRSLVSSSSAIRLGRSDQPPSSAATAGGVEALVSGEVASTGRRSGVVIGAIVGVVILAGVAFVFLSGRPRDVARDAPPAVAVPAAQPPPPALTPPPPATMAAAPVAAQPELVASAKPSAAPSPAPPPSRPHWGGEGRHGGAATKPSTPAPPPPPAATQAPAPPPAPAPTPTAAPPKANPLEDRQ